MARIAGRVINVGFGKEATRGTAVAPTVWVPNTELTFDDKVLLATNVSSLGTIEKNQNAKIVKQWAEGNLKGIIYRNSFGYPLLGLFGATSTDSVVETTAKKHRFDLVSNNQHASLTIGRKDPNIGYRCAMAMIDSLKIDYVTGNFVMYDAKFIAKKSATASDTPAYVAESEFIPKHVVFKHAAVGTTNLGAAAALTNVKSISLEIKKGVKDTQGLGNIDLENVVNTDFEVTGKIERYLDDTTFKDFVFTSAHRSMRIDLVDTDTIVGAVTNPSLRFDMDEVVFTDWSEAMGDGDVTVETISFTAIRNTATAKTFAAELVNETASY